MKNPSANTGRAVVAALGATVLMSAVAVGVALGLAGAASLERPAPLPAEPSAALEAVQRNVEARPAGSGGANSRAAGQRRTLAEPRAVAAADRALARAFEDRASDLQVEGGGTVVRVLADDEEGSRHQRFVLELATGQTLLVAHNVDLAPRIPSLAAGDRVDFYGEYEWNEKGGVIHWTHRDPAGRHAAGWLKHDGRTYQ